MFQITIGVDIAKKKFDVALLYAKANINIKSLPTMKLVLRPSLVGYLPFICYDQPLICMEATGAYSHTLG